MNKKSKVLIIASLLLVGITLVGNAGTTFVSEKSEIIILDRNSNS